MLLKGPIMKFNSPITLPEQDWGMELGNKLPFSAAPTLKPIHKKPGQHDPRFHVKNSCWCFLAEDCFTTFNSRLWSLMHSGLLMCNHHAVGHSGFLQALNSKWVNKNHTYEKIKTPKHCNLKQSSCCFLNGQITASRSLCWQRQILQRRQVDGG